VWKAEFSDNEILTEFGENGEERSFSMVLRRLADLQYLSVTTGDTEYKVSLEDGQFIISNDSTIRMYTLNTAIYNKNTLSNIRPIYFRNEQVNFEFGGGDQTVAPMVNYYSLGFQANYNDKNITRFLRIYPNNTFEIRDS
jgi:hypothetical protein